MGEAFDAGIKELEENPTIASDIESLEDLEKFLEGNLQLDISNWIDAKLINLENLNK